MQDEAGLLSSVVETVFQSLAYGLFVVLAVASTRLLVSRQGWRSRQGTIMLGMIWLMLILSSLEWTMSLVFTLSQIMSSDSVIGNVHPLHDLLTTVGKINYAIADSVLIWRAWVLCRSEYRMVLWVCSFFLGLTYLLIAIAIIFRLACNANPQDRIPPALTHALDVSQVGMLLVSTVTNTLSTGIVGVYVWKYRQFLRTAMSRDRTTLGLGVLLLIVESGVLYTTFVFFSIIGSVIRLPTGTIGDVSGDILIHIAGVYPTIIITLASVQGQMTTSAFSVHSAHAKAQPQPGQQFGSVVFARPSSSDGPILPVAAVHKPHVRLNMLSSFNFTDFEEEVMGYMDSKWEKV